MVDCNEVRRTYTVVTFSETVCNIFLMTFSRGCLEMLACGNRFWQRNTNCFQVGLIGFSQVYIDLF